MYSTILISYMLESCMQPSITRRQTNMDDYFSTDSELYKVQSSLDVSIRVRLVDTGYGYGTVYGFEERTCSIVHRHIGCT